MSRRRTLRPEEEALWQTVAKSASPMHKSRHAPVLNLPPALVPHPQPSEPMPLLRFRVGEKLRGPDLMPRPAPTAAIQMDRKAFDRLTRGKLAPEGRLDLHGMTVAEAHPELIRFILNASAEGLRLVLVITGKGKPGPDFGPIPQRYGVLKHQVPQWLRLPPLGPAILQVTEAHLKHGGAGALYVYLRRGR
jgi:DNA-nicking Smr family endonuclease